MKNQHNDRNGRLFLADQVILKNWSPTTNSNQYWILAVERGCIRKNFDWLVSK